MSDTPLKQKRHLTSARVLVLSMFAVFQLSMAADTKLYELRISGPGNDSAAIVERHRGRSVSVVTVEMKGTKVTEYSLLILRACYEIAVNRNAKYFVKLSERSIGVGERLFVIGFTNDSKPDFEATFGEKYPPEPPGEDSPFVFDVENAKILFE